MLSRRSLDERIDSKRGIRSRSVQHPVGYRRTSFVEFDQELKKKWLELFFILSKDFLIAKWTGCAHSLSA